MRGAIGAVTQRVMDGSRDGPVESVMTGEERSREEGCLGGRS